jgi:hypothetical protein
MADVHIESDAKHDDEPEDDDRAYICAVGPLDGQEIVAALANNAYIHSIAAQPKEKTASARLRYDDREFYSIMIDTSAACRSTVGYGQYEAYKRLANITLDIATAGSASIQFGKGEAVLSIGSLYVDMLLSCVEFHVVRADMLFLLSLADLDRLGVYLNNIENVLVISTNKYPVIRRFSHLFLIWKINPSTYICNSITTKEYFLTDVELRRLHRRFGYPSVKRLQRMLEHAGHNDIDKEIIEKLTKYYEHYQKHGRSPGRFRFNLQNDTQFNYSIIVDIIYINRKPVLHIVDEATRFQAAK